MAKSINLIFMKKSAIILTTVSLPLDYLMLAAAGFAAYFLRFHPYIIKIKPVIFNLTLTKYAPLMLFVALGWIVLFMFSGLYRASPTRRLMNEISRVFFACSTGLAAITIYLFFRLDDFNSRFIVLAGWALAIIFVSLERAALRVIKNLLFRAGIGVRNIAIIGSGRIADILFQTLTERRGFGYRVVGHFLYFDEKTKIAMWELNRDKKIDEILLTNPKGDEKEALAVLDFCEENHLEFKYSADLFATYLSNTVVYAIGGVPIVELQKTRLQAWGRVIKRLMDIIGSIILIILTSPFIIFSALAVLIETGRPIIYKNERVGENGKSFFTLKFRSMFQKYCIGPQFKNQEEVLRFEENLIKEKSIKEGPVYKIKDDPRVTKIGRVLRRLSFDELPQLFNVLKGNMSLVGPRPHQPREVNKYAKHQRKVLNIKPGITGLAQISGRSDLEFEDEVKLDTFYLEHWSWLLDLIILIKTPFILLKSRKAL